MEAGAILLGLGGGDVQGKDPGPQGASQKWDSDRLWGSRSLGWQLQTRGPGQMYFSTITSLLQSRFYGCTKPAF